MINKLNYAPLFLLLLILWTTFGVAYESIDIVLANRKFNFFIVFQSAFILSIIVSLPSALLLRKAYLLKIENDWVSWKDTFGRKTKFNANDVLKIEIKKLLIFKYIWITTLSKTYLIPLLFKNNKEIEGFFKTKIKSLTLSSEEKRP